MSGSMSTSPLVTQTNLVGNGLVPAAQIDSSLLNPWGVAFAPTGVFWISDEAAGLTSLFSGTSQFAAAVGHHDITITPPPGQANATPTGVVNNPDPTGFNITANGVTAPSVFIFAAQNGTINGWNPTINGGASTVIAATDTGAVYKGLTVGTTSAGTFLYAADFTKGTIDQFDSSFNQVASFTDSTIPDGFAPFNAQVINGNLFVTYAMQTPGKPAAQDPAAGAGFVDEFSLTGKLEGRIASNGDLNAPWGMAIAPSTFGQFAGDLLVGNFGSGTIDAFNLSDASFQGELLGSNGAPIVIPSLWSLVVGNGGQGGSANQVYFTAGLTNAQNGLFGTLSNNAPIDLSATAASQSNGIVTADESSAALGAGMALGTVLNFGSGVEAVQLTDGTVSVGVDTNEAFLQRLYEGLLDRGNDSGGMSFFDQQLASGVSQTTVASEFLSSPEFAALHGTVSGAQLVALDFQGLLGRSAAADPGSSFWTNLLANGTSGAAVTAGIASSSESKMFLAPATSQVFASSTSGTLVHELFETGLGREADLSGLQFFQTEAASVSPLEIASQITGSAEFQAVHAGQDNTQLVNALFQDGLGRPADAAGASFWGGLLNGGASPSSVLLGIATSPEAAGHLTQNLTA